MKKNFVVPVCVAFAATACSTHFSRPSENPAAYNYELNKAFSEADARNNMRTLASGGAKALLDADFSKLRGSWNMVVFPKMNDMTEMEATTPDEEKALATEALYDRPQEYRFSVQMNSGCAALLTKVGPGKDAQGRQKFYHREYFNPAHVADVKSIEDLKGRSCAILSVGRINGFGNKHPNAPYLNPAQWHPDDVIALKLYLDSDYRAHGMDVESATGKRESAIRNLRLNPTEPLSSGLLAFPVDLPALAVMPTSNADVEIPRDPYVQNKIKKMGIDTKCAKGSYTFHYKDVYGGPIAVTWCKGGAWPTAIENNRFFAIVDRK
jgi:hypothetical protein